MIKKLDNKALLKMIEARDKRIKELEQKEGWEAQREGLYKHRSAVTEKEEKRLYKIFVDNANKKKKLQDIKDAENLIKLKAGTPLTDEDKICVNKFTLEDVEKLGIDYDVLFISSKKGIGKTWSIKNLMAECEREDRDMIYLRQSRLAAETNIKTELNCCPTWPFKVQGTMPMKLISKSCTINDKGIERGYLGYLSGASSMYGQSYKKVKWIVFDECMSHKENDITPEDMEEWQKMLSSIIRDKKDCKVVMFGNFLQKEDDSVDQPFMTEYGLNWLDDLKILKAEAKGQIYTLLYINCRSLYEGIESQGHVLLSANKELLGRLLSNTLEPESPNIIPTDIYYGMDQELNLVYWSTDGLRLVLELRFMYQTVLKSDGFFAYEDVVKHRACRITKFIPDIHNKFAVSNSSVICSSFDYIRLVEDESFASYWEYIKMCLMSSNLLFGDCVTYILLEKTLKQFIKPVENSGFYN